LPWIGLCFGKSTVSADVPDVEPIVKKVIGGAIEVHRVMGPGLLESVYRECLPIELRERSLRVESERRIPLKYKTHSLSSVLKVDLLVEGCVLVELKAIEQINPVYIAQVITYLKLGGCPVGLLINFNVALLKSGLRRLDHPDTYKKTDLPGKRFPSLR